MQRILRGFRRLRSDNCSFAHTQSDFTKGIGLIRGSKGSKRGHVVAASVISDDTKVKKTGKRVPKDERRAMVESYVIRYKSMNNGKFPSPSVTQEHVGGSYYIIRSILQEMEHRSKASPLNTLHKNALRKEGTDVNGASADVVAVSISHAKRKTSVKPEKTVDADDVKSDYLDVKSVEEPKTSTLLRATLSDEVVKSRTTIDDNVLDHCHSSISAEEESEASIEEDVKPGTTANGGDVDPSYSSFNGVAAEEEPKASTSLRKTLAKKVDSSSNTGKQKHLSEVESLEVVVHLQSEQSKHDVKEILPSEGPHPQRQQHKLSPESDKLATGNSEKQTDNEELPKRQSFWGNLKSLADGIKKIWRGS